MMRIKFGRFAMTRSESTEYGREDQRWRCCICCHVRTGTIFLGIWNLAMNMLSLATIAVVILHPQIMENGIVRPGRGGNVGNPFIPNDQEVLAVLPTPLSAEVHEEPHALPLSFTASPVTQAKNADMSTAKMFYGSIVYKDWFAERPVNEHHLNYEDLNISIGVTFCTLAITLLMIYGAIRGKSLYLMPFFCLQAFDFFVTSLHVIGYLSYVPDIRQALVRTPNIPLRDELLAMDPQCLSLLILAGILLTLVAKVYFISIVWNCYKYLTIAAEAALERESRAVVDGQNLLENSSAMVMSGSDLPDYATAMSDPRFAKKPMYPVPPPPYAAVVNLPAEALTVEAVAAEVAAVPATETAPSTSASVTVDADPKL